jgi:transposase InsO family protein
MLADHTKEYHVVCGASDFAIGSPLMQYDNEGKERVINYASRQLRAAEKNYPVHDKELLSMKYALTKFRVYLLGSKHFTVYTDHASLRTAIKTPHLSQRMARWLSFFADYNFTVLYKPGKLNVVADALSRRPDYEPSVEKKEAEIANITISEISTDLIDQVKSAYCDDPMCSSLIDYLTDPSVKKKSSLDESVRSRLHRFHLENGVLYFRTDDGDDWRIVVPNDCDLKERITFEYHDVPTAGHPGREKTYLNLSRDFYWNNQYKFVRKYVRTCEICQRVKPSSSSQAPLHSLPVPQDCWNSVSMDFLFGLPEVNGKSGILVFVDRFSKMVHLAAVSKHVSAVQSAFHFMDSVFRLHGMPKELVSDRDPRFVAPFWREVFRLLGSQLSMSTTAHPETDGQTERVNRVLSDILRSYAHSFERWIDLLPLAEFAINNSVHSSTGLTPFFVNGFRHPRVPTLLSGVSLPLSGGGTVDPQRSSPLSVADPSNPGSEFRSGIQPYQNVPAKCAEFLIRREAVVRFVRDAIASAVDKQKQMADKRGRKNLKEFKEGSLVMLSVNGLPAHSITNLGSNKLLPRFIGPFKVLRRLGEAYTLDIPSVMKLHPTFYVGRLKEYHPSANAFAPENANPHEDLNKTVSQDRTTPPHSPDNTDGERASIARTSSNKTSSEEDFVSQSPPIVSSKTRRPEQARRSERLAERSSFCVPVHQTTNHIPTSCDRTERNHIGEELRAPPPLFDSQGERRYLVDKVVDHRDNLEKSSRTPRRMYRVRWLGYSAEHDSWESRESLLDDVPDVVQEYEDSQKL